MSEETIGQEAANAAEAGTGVAETACGGSGADDAAETPPTKNGDGETKGNAKGRGKVKSENPAERKIREYFEANASEDLKARVAKSGKTARGALEYAAARAREMAHSGNCVCVDDETVYGWCMHYFEDEDASSYEGKTTCKVATAERAKPSGGNGRPRPRNVEKPEKKSGAAPDAQLCFDI